MTLRIGLVGAVWSTEVALRALAEAGHPPAVLITLPMEKSGRHSDFVDLGPLAQDLSVPLARAEDVNDPALLERLAALELDLLMVIGWSRMCGPEFRRLPRVGALGYHPTLLPKMRGRAALAWTIILGCGESGGTLFWLDEGVDSGDIAAQQAFPVPSGVTLPALIELQKEALAAMLPPLAAALAGGEIPARPQDHDAATYLAVRRPAHGEIDWGAGADEIERLVRATSRPYPGAYTRNAGRKLLIWSARVVRYPQWHAQTGQVFTFEDGVPIVRCGGGTDLALTDYEIVTEEGEAPPKPLSGQPLLGRST
ncbi:MAG TPA: formyltransferase family protein [Allosphingosinicella sp.]